MNAAVCSYKNEFVIHSWKEW